MAGCIRNESELAETHDIYRSLVDNMLNGVAYCKVIFEDGKPSDIAVLMVNRAFAELTGLKVVPGSKLSEAMPHAFQADPGLLHRYARVALSGEPERFEIFSPLLHEWFLVSACSPKPEHVVVIFDVITERKQADERNRRLTNFFHALSATNEAILTLKSSAELFACVCRVAVEHGGMTHAWIGVPDHEGYFIPQGKHGRFSDPSYQVTLTTDPCRPEGRGPSGVAYRENRAVVVNDIDSDERLAPWLDQARRDGVKSLAAFPIERGGRPHAIFSVYSDQAGMFDHEIASLLESMAKNIGFALDNFDRDAMRRESEERFRQLANAMPQLVWIAEPDGTVNYCNARRQEYAGLNQVQDGHFEWTPALHPEDIESTVSSWHRALETGENFEAEHRLRRQDGNYRWHLSRGVPARDEHGRITKWFGTAIDIHEPRIAQDAVRRSEEILRLAQQVARIGTFDWNIRTNVIESFLESEPLYGMPPGSFGGATYERWLEFLHPEDRPTAERDIREALASGRLQAEWRIVRTDGKVRWLVARAHVFKDGAGQPLRMVGINMDVTDQKKVEEENALLSLQRKLALDAARLGWWHHDFASKKTNYDRRYREIFGFGQDEPSFKDVYARIHPDDRAAFLEKINAAIDPDNPQAYGNEYRIFRHDGSMRWIEAHGMVSFQGQGAERRAASFVGAVADITERKEAEERLKLAAMVYQDGSEGMIVADADNRIITVNPAFERITGHLAKDVIGEHMRLLFADPKNSDSYKPVGKALRTRGSWKGDLWSRRKNGRRFAAAVTINTSFHPNGSVNKRVILFSDITKKKVSDELIWSQANFDTLTGLPNRRMFRDRLEHDVRNARRNRSSLALMLLDLDGFKHVNDTLGHDMGDVLLQEAARRLKACVRDADTVARLGGDEFTVILTELHGMDNA